MKPIPLSVAIILGSALASAAGAQELAPDAVTPQSAVMAPAQPDPQASAARVTSALQGTPGVSPGDITVSTHAGTVVLTGKVNSEAERATATAVAEKAAEGARVSTNIEVRPMEERPVKDQRAVQLAGSVEAALRADKRTANLGVAVSSADGKVVVLHGLVPTRESRSTLLEVASKVDGVSWVDNRVLLPDEQSDRQ